MRMLYSIAFFCMAMPLFATTVTLVNDPFTDGDRSDGVDVTDVMWWRPSGGTVAVGDNAVLGSSAMSLANNGTVSQRRLVGAFHGVELVNVGDYVTLTLDFVLIGSGSSDRGFRFGLFDSKGTLVNADGTSYSSSGNANNDVGYMAGFSTGTYTKAYLYEENAAEGTFMGGGTSLLTSNDAYGPVSNNAKHSALLKITKALTEEGADSVFVQVWVDNGLVFEKADITTLVTKFDEVGLANIGSAADFAVDNIKVDFTSVPEPVSIALFGIGGLLLGLKRK